MKTAKRFVVVALAMMGALSIAQKANLRYQPAWSGIDRRFASDAAIWNMADVQLGSLAQEKASSDFVRQFAATVVKDHADALSELKSIAAEKRYTLPSVLDEVQQVAYNRLAATGGADFDRTFRATMIQSHENAVKVFSRYSARGNDPELRAYASKYLSVIQRHLQIIRSGRM